MLTPSHVARRNGRKREAVIRREADYWTIAYDGRLVRLHDCRGLRYLEILLRHPGRAFHVGDLVALVPGARTPMELAGGDIAKAVERSRKAVTNRIRQTLRRIRASHETLGVHLGNAVHTGKRCTYTPEQHLRWEP